MIPRPQLPEHLSLSVMLGAGAARDVCMFILGLLVLFGTPPSVDYLGVTGPAAVVWGSGFMLGAALSLIGSVRDSDGIQSAGCFIIGAAFAIWVVAAVRQPHTDVVTWQIALVFLAGIFGQVYRGIAVALGVVRTMRAASLLTRHPRAARARAARSGR